MRREIDEVRRCARALQVAIGDFLAAVDLLDRAVEHEPRQATRPPSRLEKYAGKLLLTPAEVSELTSIQESTLANWRSSGRSPLKWVKLSGQVGKQGGRVRYRLEDVKAFIERSLT